MRDAEPVPVIGEAGYECRRLLLSARQGEHKPAVDGWAELEAKGLVCADQVRRQIERSRDQLRKADQLVLTAGTHRARQEWVAARESLRQALEVYPKYHWARKLLGDVEDAIRAEVERLVAESAALLEQGDLIAVVAALERIVELEEVGEGRLAQIEALKSSLADEALARSRTAEQQDSLEAAGRWMIQALKLAPDDDALRDSLVEFARLLGLRLFSGGELNDARAVWQAALRIQADHPKIAEYMKRVDALLESLEKIRKSEGS